ncbi:hypothetical protein BJV82DRAFT_620701 [Fennellomyces sp. T-0311]|nr:hypothetical protein BJV82DRAFT_620701 [Fennellomyces sp. T-0311]
MASAFRFGWLAKNSSPMYCLCRFIGASHPQAFHAGHCHGTRKRWTASPNARPAPAKRKISISANAVFARKATRKPNTRSSWFVYFPWRANDNTAIAPRQFQKGQKSTDDSSTDPRNRKEKTNNRKRARTSPEKKSRANSLTRLPPTELLYNSIIAIVQ